MLVRRHWGSKDEKDSGNTELGEMLADIEGDSDDDSAAAGDEEWMRSVSVNFLLG